MSTEDKDVPGKKTEGDDSLDSVTIIIEGEGERVDTPPKEKGAKEEKKTDDGDRRAKDKGDEEDDQAEPEGLSPEERDALRKKRREERALQRKRAKERDEARDRELAELRRTVQELSTRAVQHERKAVESDFGRIEAGIADSMAKMEEAKGLIAKAAAEQNGAALAEAQEAYVEARERAQYLNRLKHGIVAREQEQERAPKIDPEIARRARGWMSKNSWYDPKSGDEDSMIALAIDDALAKQGFDPKTQEYWDEFEKRVAKRLPHRVTKESADEADDELEERGSPTTGSGRERATTTSKQTYHLSKARVDAMKEAGIWDDKAAREKMIKRYMQHDKEAAEKAKGASK